MDRKQGIIRLGRSRSPTNKKTHNSRLNMQSARNSQQRQILRQSSNITLNNSSHLNNELNPSTSRKIIKQDGTSSSYTLQGFYPPTSKNHQQSTIIKQNVRTQTPQKIPIISSSPVKRVIVSKPLTQAGPQNTIIQTIQKSFSQPQPPITQSYHSEKQIDLLRKIKVLETRVRELHQDKQTFVVKTHEENRKLVQDNAMLRGRLTQFQRYKNQEIIGLKTEIQALKRLGLHQKQVQTSQNKVGNFPDKIIRLNQNPNQMERPINPFQYLNQQISSNFDEESSILKNRSSLRNAAYIDEQNSHQNHYKTNQNHSQAQNNSTTWHPQLQNLQQKLAQSVNQNRQLLTKINQLQSELPQAEKRIQQLVSKLVQLETENKSIKDQLSDVKEEVAHNTTIIEQNNHKIIQNYQQKVKYLEEELSGYELELSKNTELRYSLERSQKETQNFYKKYQQKCEQLADKQSEWEEKLGNLSCLSRTHEQKFHIAEQKIKILEMQLQQSSIGNKSNAQIQIQTEQKFYQPERQEQKLFSRTSPQTCTKCTQLIKTLVKLNQKVFSKTM